MAAEPPHPRAGRFGVAGYPVGHSRSPGIHAAAYAELGIDADYQRLPIPPELFAPTVRALPGSGFKGINVTIPHKLAALEVADERSHAANMIGAANTLTFTDDGRIRADNTDAPGMLAALPSDPAGCEALVIGAGGTARAAVYALSRAGARVSIWNRTAARAAEIAEAFSVELVRDLVVAERAQIVVNATAVGMRAGETVESVLEDLPIGPAALADSLLVDFVYRQGGSPLAEIARARGGAVVDGGELLVRQAGLSFELWFGRPAPLAAMRDALAKSLG
ncbi:MAG: shikimate dehydrogenase [Solirubrobacterales bacterium]